MFVNGDYKNVYNKTSLDDVIAEAGFDPQELFAAMLSYYSVEGRTVEGLLGDDKWDQESCINDCVGDIHKEILNLESVSRKGNTKADIARRLRGIANNLENYNSYCSVYDIKDYF